MSVRTSVLYVTPPHVCIRGCDEWQSLILILSAQISAQDFYVTVVKVGLRLLYLLEGDQASISGFLERLYEEGNDAAPHTFVGPGQHSWGSRVGSLMTPVLTPEEAVWLEEQLEAPGSHAQEIQACLRWAGMRTREMAFLGLGRVRSVKNDSFPNALPNVARSWPSELDLSPL